MTDIRKQLAEVDEDLLFLDPPELYDQCVIGIASRFGGVSVVAYDLDGIWRVLMRDGMSREDAEEFFAFNMIGAWVGEKTPIFVALLTPAKD